MTQPLREREVPPRAAAGGVAAARRAAPARLGKLDQRLAWLAMFGPLSGTALAVALLFFGYGVGPIEIGLLVVMYALTMTGLEVGYHRYFAHRAFKAGPGVTAALAVLGSMAFQGPVIWWAATHRRHHHRSDQPGDPHSPNLHGDTFMGRARGLYHAHFGWLFDPACTRPAGWGEYAADLYRDPLLFRVHMSYLSWLLLGLAIPAALGGLLGGSLEGALLGLLWGGFVRMFLVDHGLRGITSITHAFGSRPYATPDRSTNNLFMVVPTLGQGWHNNHHAFPASARMGHAWWQLDLGAWVIRALEVCGLVWDVNTVDTAGSRAVRVVPLRRAGTRRAGRRA